MARPERESWRPAALGGLLVALVGVLFGAARKGRPAAAAAPDAGTARTGKGSPKPSGEPRRGPSRAGSRPKVRRPKGGRAKVRTKPRVAEAPPRSQYWPPPPPKPIASSSEVQQQDEAEDGRPPVSADSEKLGYEVEDTRAGTVVKVMAIGAGTVALSIAALFWFIAAAHRDDTRSPPLTPQQLAVIVPPGPRLQDHPIHDIAMERKREADLLTTYAWTDADHRTARIPIARAQALVVGRSLDPLPAPPPVEAKP